MMLSILRFQVQVSPVSTVRGFRRARAAATAHVVWAAAMAHMRGREELPHVGGQGQRTRVPGCDSAGAVERSYPPARGQGRRPGGATPGPRSGHCVGTGGPSGAIPRSRSGGGGGEETPLLQGKEQRQRFAGAAVKRYPTSKVRETQVRQ